MSAAGGAGQGEAGQGSGQGRPQWDMSSWTRRFRSFLQICSPLTLAAGEGEIRAAQELLRAASCTSHVHQGGVEGGRAGPSRRELEALQLVDSALHPETGETVALPFRRSAFTLFNTPLFFGIAASPTTLPWQVGWQVLNQAYNGGMNHSNRSATEPTPTRELALDFAAATGTASVLAIVMRQVMSKVPTGSGVVGAATSAVAVPLVAVIAAGSVNVLATRRRELETGVAVRTAPHGDGEVVGHSRVAAKEALRATLLSRALLPIPSLLIPGLAKAAMDRHRVLKRRVLQLPLLALAVFATQLVALPLSLAPWPWFMPLPVGDLEDDLQARAKELGAGDTVFFNKGL